MANLYNPHEQSQEQLIERFVVRKNVFDALHRELKSSDMTLSGKHYLIEGQRGMGKTTLLLRLSYEIDNDSDLQSWLIPLVLKEEAYYGIRRLFNLWETIACELGGKEQVFSEMFACMSEAYDKQVDYERACFNILIESLDQHAKKVILFVDNLGEMIRNFSGKEKQRLYDILSDSPYFQIIGASATTLEAFANHENAIYTLFQRIQLEGLEKEETYELLLELAKTYDKGAAMQRIIKQQPGRVESLRILTGGVIRTIVLLFEIFTEQEESNTLADLDTVLDRVTPLYKSRMDDLSPLQRDVVNTIALNWEAISPEEIARKTRMSFDEVSAILRELEHVFIVERVSSDSQQPFYRLKERFFNVWYLMRLASGSGQTRVLWLLHFLESWYSKDELIQHARKHIQAVSKGNYRPRAAYYLTEAFALSGQLDRETEHQMILATKNLLQATDVYLAEDLSPSDKEVFEKGESCYQNEKYEDAILHFLKMKHQDEHIQFRLGYAFSRLEHHQEAVTYFLQAVERGHVDAMVHLGLVYQYSLQDLHNAETYYHMAADRGRTDAMLNLGKLYHHSLQEHEKAEKYYLMVIKEGQVRSKVLTSGKFSLKGLKNYLVSAIKGEVNEPERYQFQDFPGTKQQYLQSIKETMSEAMFQLGNLYAKESENTEKAELYYQQAVEAGHTGAMMYLGDWYNYTLHESKKAEKYYLMAAGKDELNAIVNLGLLYHGELKNNKKAEEYYTIAAGKGELTAMNGLAWLYFEQKRKKRKALEYIRSVIENEKNMYTAHTAACIYLWNNRHEEAFQLAEEFMYAKEAYETLEKDILFYLMLLLAKRHYQHLMTYFESPELDLKERFTPLYYALLYVTDDPNYAKLPPELSEPLQSILTQVKQMAKSYA